MEKVIAVLLAILKIAGQFMEYVMSPSRRRKSVLDQIEKDKQVNYPEIPGSSISRPFLNGCPNLSCEPKSNIV